MTPNDFIEFLEEVLADAPSLHQSLLKAYLACEKIEHCSDRRKARQVDAQSELSWRQFWAVQNRVEGLFGGYADAYSELALHKPEDRPLCDDKSVSDLVELNNDALSKRIAILERVESKVSKGLWLGTLPLCEDTVQSTRFDTQMGQETLVISMRHE